LQTSPLRQAWPHEPQFFVSIEKLTHCWPQAVKGFEHWQWPEAQNCDTPQTLPHEPQFCVSLEDTQTSLHNRPLAQAHCPDWQVSPARHL
jgi:hypothetical protein